MILHMLMGFLLGNGIIVLSLMSLAKCGQASMRWEMTTLNSDGTPKTKLFLWDKKSETYDRDTH